jgi:hypothetical protein
LKRELERVFEGEIRLRESLKEDKLRELVIELERELERQLKESKVKV